MEKVGAIEFYTIEDYLKRRTHNGLYKDGLTFWQIVHELSHWYHWYLTNYGYSAIDQAWNAVMNPKNKKFVDYTSVEHIAGDRKTAYATVNSQEYFASLSAAYFSPANDYYPFNLADLKSFDTEGYLMVKQFWKLGRKGVNGMHDRAFDGE